MLVITHWHWFYPSQYTRKGAPLGQLAVDEVMELPELLAINGLWLGS